MPFVSGSNAAAAAKILATASAPIVEYNGPGGAESLRWKANDAATPGTVTRGNLKTVYNAAGIYDRTELYTGAA